MIEMIEVETLRLSRLTTRLLATARLDRDEVQPRLEPTSLTDLVARIVDQCPAEAHRVSIDFDGSNIEVASDSELLTLVLAQLLDNALKYSPPKSAVEIGLASKSGVAYVRVKNQGGFIAPGERERIFHRFYRGESAGRVPGAGLGLYVARKIAHAHLGSLELEDPAPQGKGTTFCLTLPILEVRSQHARQAS
jgi:signal transduction histidine kinase